MRSGAGERGAAVLLVLVATAMLTSLGVGLVLATEMETAVAANFRSGTQALYAADAAIEQLVADLRATSQWTAILDGTRQPTFTDATFMPVMPGGRPLDLIGATAEFQMSRDAETPVGIPRPRWRVFSHGPLSGLVGPVVRASDAYLVVWVADDVSDPDGDPMVDANDRLTAVARAYGARDARREIEVTLARRAPGVVEFLSWREVR
jgi:PilX N-terminal